MFDGRTLVGIILQRARRISVGNLLRDDPCANPIALGIENRDPITVVAFVVNASTDTHLERQGALTEASRRVNQLLAQRRTTSGSFPRH